MGKPRQVLAEEHGVRIVLVREETREGERTDFGMEVFCVTPDGGTCWRWAGIRHQLDSMRLAIMARMLGDELVRVLEASPDANESRLDIMRQDLEAAQRKGREALADIQHALDVSHAAVCPECGRDPVKDSGLCGLCLAVARA